MRRTAGPVTGLAGAIIAESSEEEEEEEEEVIRDEVIMKSERHQTPR